MYEELFSYYYDPIVVEYLRQSKEKTKLLNQKINNCYQRLKERGQANDYNMIANKACCSLAYVRKLILKKSN